MEGAVRWVSADANFTPYFALTEHDRSRLSYIAELDLPEAADQPSGVPLVVLLLFGYAINMDPRNLYAGVADLSGTTASRQLVPDLAHSQVLDLRYQPASAEDLEGLLRAGKISVGLLIPQDFERRLELRTFYKPERRSPVNTVPGLVGVILTMTMVLFTAIAIVRERERGNLELLILVLFIVVALTLAVRRFTKRLD